MPIKIVMFTIIIDFYNVYNNFVRENGTHRITSLYIELFLNRYRSEWCLRGMGFTLLTTQLKICKHTHKVEREIEREESISTELVACLADFFSINHLCVWLKANWFIHPVHTNFNWILCSRAYLHISRPTW